MTTTPAPTDLDALTALEQAATPAPWAHEHDGGHIVHGPEGTVAEADYAPDARLIAAMRNQLPALLALASTCTCATTYATYEGPEVDCAVHGAVRALSEAVRERAAAREELAKTRAELARLATRHEALRNKLTPKGFGRRNTHCNNCGDERGGPFGHEASECRYRSGMAAYEAAEIQPEHRRAEFWDVLINRHLAMELGEFTVTLNRANPATTAEPAVSLLTCGTCYGSGEAEGNDCTSCSIRATRCTSCDHLVSFHQPDGCWYSVTVGTPDKDLVCPCAAARAPEPADEPKATASFALEVPPDCPRGCQVWCKAYEEGTPCPQDAEPAAS